MKKIVAFSQGPWPSELLDHIKSFHIPINPVKIQKLEDWKVSWEYVLYYDLKKGLVLKDKENRKLQIDFDEDQSYHRKAVSKRSDPLLKALGLNSGRERVWDLSAGLGRDAVMMASYGLQVTSYERNPALFILLNHAHRTSKFTRNLKLRFHFQDAKDVIASLPKKFPENGVLYFDPMFPAKKKSALPPQEMVILRSLVGEDADALNVIERARSHPGVRLVVKRADSSPPLVGVGHSVLGKMVRFDVFTSA